MLPFAPPRLGKSFRSCKQTKSVMNLLTADMEVWASMGNMQAERRLGHNEMLMQDKFSY